MKNLASNINNEAQSNAINLSEMEIKNRIRKHLSDINDVITEEDIKNIRTDIYDVKPTLNPSNNHLL